MPRPIASMTLTSVLSTSSRTVPAVSGCRVSGTKIFAIINVPGAVMITAVNKQALCLDAKEDVSGHDAAEMCHARGHHGHQLRLCHPRQKRPDGQRRFRLTHEDTGGHIEASRRSPA